jgi:hypothetical protein
MAQQAQAISADRDFIWRTSAHRLLQPGDSGRCERYSPSRRFGGFRIQGVRVQEMRRNRVCFPCLNPQP